MDSRSTDELGLVAKMLLLLLLVSALAICVAQVETAVSKGIDDRIQMLTQSRL